MSNFNDEGKRDPLYRNKHAGTGGNGGQTAPHEKGESAGVTLREDVGLSGQTPVQIDERLAELYDRLARHTDLHEKWSNELSFAVAKRNGKSGLRARASAAEVAAGVEEARRLAEAGEGDYRTSAIIRYADEVNNYVAAIDALEAKIDPLQSEFEDRGGWTRAFLVTNKNGHVHKSMNCSTCTPRTRFHWVTEFSGGSETDVVEAAGERACTVCYPSAPVETLNRPTTIFSPDERAAAEDRARREVEKAERLAKTIEKGLTQDGSPFRVEFQNEHGFGESESFKTEQAATQWLVNDRVNFQYFFSFAPTSERVAARQSVVDAIKAKHQWSDAEVEAMLDKKVKAKAKRDGFDV